MSKILLLDNFDSFTYNLFQQIKKIQDCEILVIRNDEEIPKNISEFDKIVISPGPKDPASAGISNQIIRKYYKEMPILGVCLGMQCINEVFGGKTVPSPLPVHGKKSRIKHLANEIFNGVSEWFEVARYHSLIVDEISEELEVIALTQDDIPMAIKHKTLPVYGVQFHPESFMTPLGDEIMKNFLAIKS